MVDDDALVPKPVRVTISLSNHDRQIIQTLCEQRGWSRSRAVRWVLRKVGEALAKAKTRVRFKEDLLSLEGEILRGEVMFGLGEVTIRLPEKCKGWKLVVEYT